MLVYVIQHSILPYRIRSTIDYIFHHLRKQYFQYLKFKNPIKFGFPIINSYIVYSYRSKFGIPIEYDIPIKT